MSFEFAHFPLFQAEPLPSLFGEKYGVQLVLASDVVYHEEIVEILMQTIVKLFIKYGGDASSDKQDGGIAAIICFEMRHAEVTELFLASAYELFECEFIPAQHQHPDYQSSCIAMVKLTPKKQHEKKIEVTATQKKVPSPGTNSSSIFSSAENKIVAPAIRGGKMSKSERRKMKAKAKAEKLLM